MRICIFSIKDNFQPVWCGWRREHHLRGAGGGAEVHGPEPHRAGAHRDDQWDGRGRLRDRGLRGDKGECVTFCWTFVLQEFVALMQKKSAEDEHSDDIEEAFKVFDTKNDGWIINCCGKSLSCTFSPGDPSLSVDKLFDGLFQGYLRRGTDERHGQSGQPSDNGGDKGLECYRFSLFINCQFPGNDRRGGPRWWRRHHKGWIHKNVGQK